MENDLTKSSALLSQKYLSAYSFNSCKDEAAVNLKILTSQPSGIRGAISESVITNAAERSPFSQPRSRASRKLRASASRPAATNIVRAQRKNSGQRETIATSESGEGRFCPRIDSTTDAE